MYPSSQEQVNEPAGVLVQVAFGSQLWLPSAHSSMSVHVRPSPSYPEKQVQKGRRRMVICRFCHSNVRPGASGVPPIATVDRTRHGSQVAESYSRNAASPSSDDDRGRFNFDELSIVAKQRDAEKGAGGGGNR